MGLISSSHCLYAMQTKQAKPFNGGAALPMFSANCNQVFLQSLQLACGIWYFL